MGTKDDDDDDYNNNNNNSILLINCYDDRRNKNIASCFTLPSTSHTTINPFVSTI
jgi:hypothetical protein